MEEFEKGTKRKCTACSTLFFDFGKFPTKCPNCGAEVNTLLTNVSKRGRPPKNAKVEKQGSEEIKIEEIQEIETEDDVDNVQVDDTDDTNVEEIVEIDREKESPN